MVWLADDPLPADRVGRELTANTAVEVSCLGSKISNVGIPDSNINQLTEEQLRLGPTLLERVPNPFFEIVHRSSPIGDPTNHVGAAD
jgi:hypothetical protein